MKRLLLIPALALAGCAGSPVAPLGESVKHGATAIRYFAAHTIEHFTFLSVTYAPPGTMTARIFDCQNWPPTP